MDASVLSRRALLRTGLAGAAGFCCSAAPSGAPADAGRPAEGRYREAAFKAARWIQACKVDRPAGAAWPADPARPESVSADLYAGAAGVVVFLLEVHRLTAEPGFLKDATAGADYLLSQLSGDPPRLGAGLYTGLAGIGFCLERVFQVTHGGKYRDGVAQCLRKLQRQVHKAGAGVEWNEATDIISGGAGIGLYLLQAARELDEPRCLELAWAAGKRLAALGEPEHGGLKWRTAAGSERWMPNFSHGTAGVCYFLATLFQWTRERAFLDAALAGARYLCAVADTEGGGCRVFHHEPGGKDLYYLGWCHGPTGTARLFYRLYQATDDRAWMEWVHRCARSLLSSGIPQKQAPGFWNNVGRCCGSAGVGEFFLGLYRTSKRQRYLDFCEQLAADVLARATSEKDGLKWVQAEFRVRPNEVVAQTGLMQGAAGIGLFLLRLDACHRGAAPGVCLPDAPL